MKGLLKQDHEVLFQRIRTFRDKLTSANHEGGFFNLLRGLKRFMLSLIDYRQDCKTVFIVWHGRSLCQRSSSIAWRHKELLCSRLDISSNSTESLSGTLNHYLNVKYLDSLIAQVRQKNCILVFSNLNRAILNIVLWRFPLKKKLWFENFRNSTCLGNGTFQLYRPDSSDRAFNYFSCKQDKKERYWGQQFKKWKGTFRSGLTEMSGPVKEDHLWRWSKIFRSDLTKMVRSAWFLTGFPEFWTEWKAPDVTC